MLVMYDTGTCTAHGEVISADPDAKVPSVQLPWFIKHVASAETQQRASMRQPSPIAENARSALVWQEWEHQLPALATASLQVAHNTQYQVQ